jgi:sulfhydrogenase subunit alpha
MSTTATSRHRTISVDHLARVEGHGGITVTMDGDRIDAVRFDVFEGIRLIEGLIGGRRWDDVSQIVSRICAICSVAHALTSIRATEQAFGIETSAQTELLRDLLWRGENIESHSLHIFLLAAPDYLGYPSGPAMAADHPDAVATGLRLKQLGNRVMEVVGGRSIHPVNAVPGGFGAVPTAGALTDLRADLVRSREDVAATLDLVLALPPVPALDSETAFVALRPREGYRYDLGDEVVVLRDGDRIAIPADRFRESAPEHSVRHSHAKHTLLDGRSFMVGALARLAVNGDRLTGAGRDALHALGLQLPSRDPLDNNLAQAVEIANDVERSIELIDRILELGPVPEAPAHVRPRAGTGTVITEAPRGILLHSYTYGDDGRIQSADVITPTAFNAASIETHFRAVVERDGVDDEARLKRSLEMVARAYDPCISCSVHLVRRRE